MMKRNQRLLDAKITQYLLPGIMMALALQLGNVVDTMLVGNLLGTNAMSAVSLALPVETIIQLPGYVLGAGGSIAAGVYLGRRDREQASRIFSQCFYVTLFSGILFALLAPFVSAPLGAFLARGGNLTGMATGYLRVSFLGAPVIGISLLMISFMGVENHPQLSSIFLIVSNVINLIFDYLLLRYTSMGTAGASLSTVLGFLLGMAVVVFYIRSPKRMISLRKPGELSLVKEALTTGMPVLVLMIMTMVKSLGLNQIIIRTLGDNGMAVYTVCENVLMIVEMVTGGVIGIIPNIVGILYGEKDYYGIRVVCRRVLSYTAAASAGILALVMLLPGPITQLFGVTDAALLAVISHALRLFMLCLPFYIWNKFLINYYESVEFSGLASFITLIQNGVILLPAAALGILFGQRMGYSGYNALAISYVLSELITMLLAVVYRRMRCGRSDFYILPAESPDVTFDFTIRADLKEVPAIPREIIRFATEHGVSRDKANITAVAAEEMAVNCIRYGGKNNHWIDICLTILSDSLMLRFRDNGIPFDPSAYERDGDEFDSIHGIQVIRDLCTDISYIRAVDMNNTVLIFDNTTEEGGSA